MSKIIITLAFFISGTLLSFAQEPTHNLTIEISGMKSDKGFVYLSLFNAENTFLKDAFRGDVVKIKNKKATIIFKNIPEGTYAFSLFHDENENKKMDSNFLGIPKERYGFSNNAKGFMGPAKYKNAKFIFSKDITSTVKIH